MLLEGGGLVSASLYRTRKQTLPRLSPLSWVGAWQLGPRPLANIQCQVVRTDRRSTAIYIERDGSVLVRAPLTVDDIKLAKLVTKKLPWIYRNLALWNELNRDTPRREFVSGETFYVEGQPCILDVREDTAEPLSLTGDRLVLRKSARPKAEELFRAMYRERG